MKFGYFIAILSLLVSVVYAAPQNHPTSQLAPFAVLRDVNLDLGSHDLIADNVRNAANTLRISLLSATSTLYGLNIGTGGFVCTTCIDTADIANDAITQAKLADNSVGTNEIIDDSVTSSEIVTGAVGGAEIADESVSSSDIGNGAVGNTELFSDAASLYKVSGAKLSISGNDLKIETDGACIKNQAGSCKITFSGNNIIFNI